ncbi:MAG: hypothetical protein Q9216_007123 [Gyalolechia sp. 2 TL-2023]
MEEGRVVEMLEKKWVKTNDTVSVFAAVTFVLLRCDIELADLKGQINTQLVPPFEPLLAGMPSGREIHSSTTYVPPELDPDVLEKMRAPPDPEEARALMAADGADSSDEEGPVESGLPGSFPGKSPYDNTASEYY